MSALRRAPTSPGERRAQLRLHVPSATLLRVDPGTAEHRHAIDRDVRLFHVSEDPSIREFAPRPARADAALDGPVVWAIDEPYLANYLLPRECPRVTFARSRLTTPEDGARLLGLSAPRRVVAIEAAWLERVASTELLVYELNPVGFRLQDASAGYYVSAEHRRPLGVVRVPRPIDAQRGSGVEVRVCDTLWPLHDAVRSSSLEFSMTRMRNAAPRG
jgi:hypothetical protein